MPKDIKLIALAKELNVGVGSIQETLEKKNLIEGVNITPNTRVSRQIAEQLIAEHGRGLDRAKITDLLDKLDGSKVVSKPAEEKPAPTPKPEKAEEEKPVKSQYIETSIPEERRMGLKIKGNIADLQPKAEPTAEKEVKPAPQPESKVEAKPKAKEVKEVKPSLRSK